MEIRSEDIEKEELPRSGTGRLELFVAAGLAWGGEGKETMGVVGEMIGRLRMVGWIIGRSNFFGVFFGYIII